MELDLFKKAELFDLKNQDLISFGADKAKISQKKIDQLLAQKRRGKLVLVSAISPTPFGEGKSTTTIGLGDALSRLKQKALITLREPSLGPCFGKKGGATGGGKAQLVPADDINLHFTGDFHAIGSAHNLLNALLDNYIHFEQKPKVDLRQIWIKRCLDMNERALRNIVIGMGGANGGVPRESGFDITVATETMAIFCLAKSLEDLQRHLQND